MSLLKAIYFSHDDYHLSSSSTYYEVMKVWLFVKQDAIKEQTYLKYLSLVENHIKEEIGKERIKRITTNMLLAYIKKKTNLGKLDQTGGLSVSSLKTLAYILKSTLRFAEKKKLCRLHDLDLITCKNEKKKIEVLNKSEQSFLEQWIFIKMNYHKLGILICLYTGLRLGEICGLMWRDIDFENKTLSVERTVQRVKDISSETKQKTKLIISDPKSDTSRRIIPLPDFLVDILEVLKKEDFIFIVSNSLKPQEPRVYESVFKNMLKKSDVHIINFHALRHTFATRSIESGMDIKTLSEILGHSSVQITLEIYVHSSMELKRSSLNSLAAYMTN